MPLPRLARIRQVRKSSRSNDRGSRCQPRDASYILRYTVRNRNTSGVVLALALGAPGIARADPRDSVIENAGFVRAVRPYALTVGIGAARTSGFVQHIVSQAFNYGIAPALADGMTIATSARDAHSGHGATIIDIIGSYHGIPMSRPIARGLVDGEGRIRLLSLLGPVGPLVSRTPSVSAAQALASVRAAGLPTAGDSDVELVELVELVAHARVDETRLVWQLQAPLDLVRASRPVIDVDAHTGAIVRVSERVQTAYARAFFRNPVRDPSAGNYPLVSFDSRGSGLTGQYFAAFNCVAAGFDVCEAMATAAPDGQGDFIYREPDVSAAADNVQPEDPFAEVSIYYHADKFLSYLQGFGFSSLPCNQTGQRSVLLANFKLAGANAYDNAFYSGDCEATLVFGQGSQVDFAYDGDVVYHEVAHAAIEQQLGGWLGAARERPDALLGDAGAINEALADFLSSAFARDPVVGEYVGAYWLGSSGIRVNDNVYRCPEDLVGEVHVDSEPLAGALWDSYTQFGEVLVPIVLDMISMLAEDATFEEVALAVETLTELSLGADAGDVMHGILDDRGLLDCPRVIAPDDLRSSLFVSSAWYVPYTPSSLQFRVDVPNDMDTLELIFQPSAYVPGGFGSDGDIDPGLLVKSGSPIVFSYGSEDGEFASVSSDASFYQYVDTGYAAVPVIPGSPAYFGFVNAGAATMRVDGLAVGFAFLGQADTASATETATTEDPTNPSASEGELGEHDSKDGGCGCRQSSPSTPTVALAGGLLVWVAAGRGRRRTRRRG